MRAIFLEEEISVIAMGEEFQLKGTSAHHLLKVLRVKVGSEVLGLNGEGQKTKLLITNVNKSKIYLKKTSIETQERKLNLDLAIGQTKKDAMDLILKQSVELGIRNIYIVESQHSQRYDFNFERARKLMISAMEQSNNPYLPEVKTLSLEKVPLENYKTALFFSSFAIGEEQDLKLSSTLKDDSIILIGPEAGFNDEEENILRENPIVKTFMLETYILRSSTAISAAVGFFLGKISA